MYPLLASFASLLLVLWAALALKPVPAAPGAALISLLDRTLGYRLCAAAVVLSLLLIAGLMAAYSANPELFRWEIERPIDRLVTDYHWAIPLGVGLYAIVRLCGARRRPSLWLLCLSLPGALIFPVTVVAALLMGIDRMDEMIFEFLIWPETWILSIIAVRQCFLLRKPLETHVLSMLAQTLLIVVSYLQMSFV
ncbi:MAG: hypothetical protein JO084_15520 [Bradyrhizobiaceae bacterium]|nr:hypothetical protein [Bradyrhizobiaceae bacterium]